MSNQVTLDIVLPALNEFENLKVVVAELFDEFRGGDHDQNAVALSSIIVVDDGSTDALQGWQPTNSAVSVIHLSRNFGKEAAMLAGLDFSTADYVMLMDADGQHRVSDARRLIDTAISEDVNQVVGIRDRSDDPLIRKVLSRLFFALSARLFGVKSTDGAGDFRVLSRKVVSTICQLREVDRYSKGIFEWVGFSSREIPIKTDDRLSGTSKFTFRRLFALAISGLFAFNDGLLRRLMWLGLISVMVSLGLLVPVLWNTVLGSSTPDGFLTLVGLQFLLAGTQVLLLSLVGEYVARTHRQGRGRPVYIIDEIVSAD